MMELNEIYADEYFNRFQRHDHVYNTRPFIELNVYKCDRIRFFMFTSESKARLGIVLGEKEEQLLSPFSAPFGGFDVLKRPGIERFNAALEVLNNLAAKEGKKIKLTLPPVFYSPRDLAIQTTLLTNTSFAKIKVDYNYHFNCRDAANYQAAITPQARNHLLRAEKADYRFEIVAPTDDAGVSRAYEVIRQNRVRRGYPLRMSINDVRATIRIVRAEFFILILDSVDVAAAQVYYPADGIAQVIYWGDVEGYADRCPMNMLACRLFEYLSQKVRIVDVGPSSSDGIPAIGQCDFKESVGCRLTGKYSVYLG